MNWKNMAIVVSPLVALFIGASYFQGYLSLTVAAIYLLVALSASSLIFWIASIGKAKNSE